MLSETTRTRPRRWLLLDRGLKSRRRATFRLNDQTADHEPKHGSKKVLSMNICVVCDHC